MEVVTTVSCVPQDTLEDSDPQEFVNPTFTVIRDITIENISYDQLKSNNLELDSDICDNNGEIISMNRNKFITNTNFSNADEINQYLRYWGKIPQFLEVRQTEHKGYGIFTLQDISPDTPIGVYLGIPRINYNLTLDNPYLYRVLNFHNEYEGIFDAENLTYSNFARFINHQDTPNCRSTVCSLMILITSEKYIPKGSELSINYGESYWKGSQDEIKE